METMKTWNGQFRPIVQLLIWYRQNLKLKQVTIRDGQRVPLCPAHAPVRAYENCTRTYTQPFHTHARTRNIFARTDPQNFHTHARTLICVAEITRTRKPHPHTLRVRVYGSHGHTLPIPGYDYVTISGKPGSYSGSDPIRLTVPDSTIIHFHSGGDYSFFHYIYSSYSPTNSGFVLEWTCAKSNSQYNSHCYSAYHQLVTIHIVTICRIFEFSSVFS